jgi:hypothetical protein
LVGLLVGRKTIRRKRGKIRYYEINTKRVKKETVINIYKATKERKH